MFNKRIVLAATILTSALATPAMAQSLRHSAAVGTTIHVGHGSQRSCTWRGHTYAGTLMIDGRRTIIRSNQDVKYQIQCAFRRAGYGVSYDRGQLLVHFRYCRPNVRWYADGYNARFDWRNGCVRISLSNQTCGPCSTKGGHGHGHGGRDDGYRDNGYQGNRRGWQRRPGRPYRPTRGRNSCG